MTDIIKFDLPEAAPSIIMVVGVGGGGSNAVNHMHHLGITDVSFMVCNTDLQALNRSQIPIRIVLGQSLTQGLGAGNKPEIGRAAAEESYDEIVDILKRYGTRMVFVTAGMGGGTGTGAAPIIAKAAKELEILTVAIVTIPFKTEGRKRFNQAFAGIEEIKKYVDSLLVINNENILEMHGELALSEAFGMADDILASAAKGIAEIITGDSYVNVDFKDVQTVMSNSGVALMGSARATGENRADIAVKSALTSPLLNHKDISGARNILINITYGSKEVTLTEMHYITEYVQDKTGYAADLIWGAGKNESLGDDIQVTIIATGFDADVIGNMSERYDTPAVIEATECSVIEPSLEQESSTELEEPLKEEIIEEEKPVNRLVPPVQNTTPPIRSRGFVPPVPKESPFQRQQAIGRATIVSGGDNDGYVVVEQSQVFVNSQTQTPQDDINYEELEKSPAWLRRKMSFSEVPSDDKVSRVTLKEDSSSTSSKKAESPNALFE